VETGLLLIKSFEGKDIPGMVKNTSREFGFPRYFPWFDAIRSVSWFPILPVLEKVMSSKRFL
jgi:hypothetical protein